MTKHVRTAVLGCVLLLLALFSRGLLNPSTRTAPRGLAASGGITFGAYTAVALLCRVDQFCGSGVPVGVASPAYSAASALIVRWGTDSPLEHTDPDRVPGNVTVKFVARAGGGLFGLLFVSVVRTGVGAIAATVVPIVVERLW